MISRPSRRRNAYLLEVSTEWEVLIILLLNLSDAKSMNEYEISYKPGLQSSMRIVHMYFFKR